MGWKIESFLVAILFGVWGYFAAKASPVYGPKAACFLQMCGYAVLIVVLGFGRTDLAKIAGPARWYGIASTVAAVIAVYWLFRLVARIPPEEAAIAYVISGSYPLITALFIHSTEKPLEQRDWVGILIVTVGLVVLGWPKK